MLYNIYLYTRFLHRSYFLKIVRLYYLFLFKLYAFFLYAELFLTGGPEGPGTVYHWTVGHRQLRQEYLDTGTVPGDLVQVTYTWRYEAGDFFAIPLETYIELSGCYSWMYHSMAGTTNGPNDMFNEFADFEY